MKSLIVKKNKLRNDAMRLREVKFDEKVGKKYSMKLNKEQDDLWHKYEFYDNIIKAMSKSEVRK